MGRSRIDVLAVSGAALALASGALYVAVMRQQADRPLVWVLAVLVLGAAAAGVAADRRVRRSIRLTLLFTAGVVLALLGLLAILTIGVVILAAAVLCFLAGVRADIQRPPRRAERIASP